MRTYSQEQLDAAVAKAVAYERESYVKLEPERELRIRGRIAKAVAEERERIVSGVCEVAFFDDVRKASLVSTGYVISIVRQRSATTDGEGEG